ncbi:hypothetical protein, partial [Testudinibacter sp. TR-2022]|uniref:hypothetical protein n=1 Tax=Testudinibacter sp. TR-2022 TaxID=2585029 RepID=UPI0022780F6E
DILLKNIHNHSLQIRTLRRCEVRIIDIQEFFATPFSHFFSVFYQTVVFYTKSGQKLFFNINRSLYFCHDNDSIVFKQQISDNIRLNHLLTY